MTPKEIVDKWIGTELSDDDPVTKEATAAIMAGLRADIEDAIAAETEACARLVELPSFIGLDDLAKAIRARSK